MEEEFKSSDIDSGYADRLPFWGRIASVHKAMLRQAAKKVGYFNAEDLVNDTIITLERRDKDYDPSKSKFITWACNYVEWQHLENTRNAASYSRAGFRKRVDTVNYEAIPEEYHPSIPSFEGAVLAKLDSEERMSRLDSRRRRVIELAISGNTNVETAKELGISQGRVLQLRREAVQKMAGERRNIHALVNG